MKPGSLLVVGTGYLIAGQVTPQAEAAMRQADKLFYSVGSVLTRIWIEGLNASAESLHDTYGVDKDRSLSYQEMVGRILAAVRKGIKVCVALYGHPGVFAQPGHAAIRQARAEGYEARMLPGISAADCLYADLGVDPGARGCQSFEATDFLLRRRLFDPTSALILWQIGAIGVVALPSAPCNRDGLQILCEVLGQHYPADHEVVIYEASGLPIREPFILRVPLSGLQAAEVSWASTLYVPPLADRPADPDMLDRLEL